MGREAKHLRALSLSILVVSLIYGLHMERKIFEFHMEWLMVRCIPSLTFMTITITLFHVIVHRRFLPTTCYDNALLCGEGRTCLTPKQVLNFSSRVLAKPPTYVHFLPTHNVNVICTHVLLD